MKKLSALIILIVFAINANSQIIHNIPYYNWSNKVAFMTSPSPLVTGYGLYSDSLSNVNDGINFYEYNGEYYPIETWADYYYWYVKKYWYQFDDPGLYEFYYLAEDDFGMAQYICSNSYRGRMYPTRFVVSFPGRSVYVNNLSRRNIRRCIKNESWENKNYLARVEPTVKDDKNIRNRSVTKCDMIRVVDREKLQSNKRDAKIVKYNNSRSTISRTNNLDNRRIDRKTNIDNLKIVNSHGNNTWRTTNVGNSNKSANRTSSFNNRSIDWGRNKSTNATKVNIKRNTSTNQIRSSRTIKSK